MPEPVPYANLQDPQTLNLYTYARNNPLSHADDDGHFWHELWNKFAYGVWTTDDAAAKKYAHDEAVAAQKQFEEWARQQRAQGKPVMVRAEIPIGPPGANVAEFEQYKDALRAEMSAPSVVDAELKGLVDDLYKPGATVGSGSTAAAVREEARTGLPVGGRWHGPKAEQYVKALESWLKNHPTAASGDRAAAENLIKDMKNALSGK